MAALVPNAGEEWVVDKLLDVSGTGIGAITPKWIGWGTSATAEAEADTTLVAEVVDTARAVGTASKTGSGDTAKHQVIGTITATVARTIQEVGLFTALTVGVLIVRAVHGSTVLATGEGIQYTITIDPE